MPGSTAHDHGDGPHGHGDGPHGHGDAVCERCGSADAVQRGLCRRCRTTLRGEGHDLPPERSRAPHPATPRPPRNPPWRRRGA